MSHWAPGVAVPVPGAPEVGPGFDDAERRHTTLGQPRGRQQPAEATADDDHIDVLVDRVAGGLSAGQRVDLDEAGQLATGFAVLVDAVGAQPLVALAPVALAQRLWVETQFVGQTLLRVAHAVSAYGCHDPSARTATTASPSSSGPGRPGARCVIDRA